MHARHSRAPPPPCPSRLPPPQVSTSYITCPADPAKTLGIRLPFLVLIVKNLNR